MIIENIQLKNYRQYIDENITFTQPNNSSNISIIQGANGCGKTNLLNAITWCLYGSEKHMERKKRGLPLISMPTIEEMNVGDTEEVKVELKMRDADDKKIYIKRSLEYRKSKDGSIKPIPDPYSSTSDGSKFEIIREIKNDMVSVKTPNYVLNRLIPENLEEYFFFDGEKLNDYFKGRPGEKIKEEIIKISQLDLLDIIISHLKNKRRDYRNEFSKLNPKADSIKQDLDKKEKILEELESTIKNKKEDKSKAEIEEQKYNEYLNEIDNENLNKLQEEREKLETDLDSCEKEINKIENSKFNYLISYVPLVYLYDPMMRLSN